MAAEIPPTGRFVRDGRGDVRRRELVRELMRARRDVAGMRTAESAKANVAARVERDAATNLHGSAA